MFSDNILSYWVKKVIIVKFTVYELNHYDEGKLGKLGKILKSQKWRKNGKIGKIFINGVCMM